MSEPYLRLQEARRRAGFETASDAARAFGWNENTYRSHENGERGLRPGVVAQYARAFKSSPSWILMGETPQIEVTAIEREPILMYEVDKIAELSDEGKKIYVDTLMVYSSIPHKFLLLRHSLFPRYERYDLLILTPAQIDNYISRNGFLMKNAKGEFHFGDLTEVAGITYIKTPNDDFISTADSEELYVVMAVVKRPFYELTDEPPAPTG